MNLEIELPPLFPYQEKVIASPARFKLWRAGRQSGKSLAAAIIAIRRAVEKPNQFILIVAPSVKQTENIYKRYLVKLLGPLIEYPVSKGSKEVVIEHRKSENRLNFWNGSSIVAVTAENPDLLRGYSIDLAILDEAAFMTDMTIWQDVLRPALLITRGDVLFISTPPKKPNWWSDLWKEVEEHQYPDWELFHTKSEENPMADPEALAQAKNSGDAYYMREYEAEFIFEDEAAMFQKSMFHFYKYSNDNYFYGSKIVPVERCQRIMTADLALTKSTYADYTAYAVADMYRDGTLFVRNVYRERVLGSALARHILNFAQDEQVDIIHVERVGFQLTIIQELREMGVTVAELPTKGDKIARAATLRERMIAQQILYPETASWLVSTVDELTSFPSKRVHDDRVDALSYAAHVASKYASFRGEVAFGSVSQADIAQDNAVDNPNTFTNIRDRGSMALEKRRGLRGLRVVQ